MTTKTYNNWTNYETWCVNLWLTNEEETSQELDSIVQDRAVNSTMGEPLNAWYKAEMLKHWVLDLAPLDGANMFTDLLQSALDNVNWQEIIENHQND